MEGTDETPGPADQPPRRACDQCRTRKIRCDKEFPCSNCRLANRTCSSNGANQRMKEPRQRVLISAQYERKIDHFEARLNGIEDLLRKISISLESRSAHGPQVNLAGNPSPSRAPDFHHSTPSIIGDNSGTPYDHDNNGAEEPDSATFEGTSSLTAQTALASEFLEDAVEKTSLRELSPEMRSALSSLKQIVRMQHQKSSTQEIRFENQQTLPRGGVRELPMPPLPIVVSMLREIKDTRPLGFALLYPLLSVEQFIQACQKVYFPTEEFNIATFILANTGLYTLFQERLALHEHDPGSAEFEKYQRLCRDNLETALANLPLLLPAKMEYVQALLLGANYAIEVSKASLAWQLNSVAAQLCVTLGYHRIQHQADDNEGIPLDDPRSDLFTFLYVLDKGLALRLGRAPMVCDYDIVIPRPPHSGIGLAPGVADPWREMSSIWIQQAEVQGAAYEQLYSMAALGKPAHERAEHARVLAERLKDIVRQAVALRMRIVAAFPSAARAVNEDILRHDIAGPAAVSFIVLKSDEVSLWSSLALVTRAIPPPPGHPSRFNSECIEAARAAFRSHQECMRLTGSIRVMKSIYLHWTVLYAPFIPFIVIFCHVIETSNLDDLRILADFVGSLQESRGISEAVDKLHRLCQVLYNIAALYVEAKERQQRDQDMIPIGNDFDLYLSQLGFVPQNSGQAPSSQMEGQLLAPPEPTMQLGDWYSGGRHMMGLLEEDLSMFNPEDLGL